MINPFVAWSAVSSLLQGIGGGASRKREAKEDREHDREMSQMRVASDESALNPFRHQMDQAGSLARLDAMENASYAPVKVRAPARYAAHVPQVSGGFSWEPSADVRAGAGKLKQSVMAGRTAPSMTSPENYGRTATLDLTRDVDPRTDAAFSGGAPNRDTLGAPEAPKAYGWRTSVPGKTPLTHSANQITSFEQENPGWTIDETGRVSRIARA